MDKSASVWLNKWEQNMVCSNNSPKPWQNILMSSSAKTIMQLLCMQQADDALPCTKKKITEKQQRGKWWQIAQRKRSGWMREGEGQGSGTYGQLPVRCCVEEERSTNKESGSLLWLCTCTAGVISYNHIWLNRLWGVKLTNHVKGWAALHTITYTHFPSRSNTGTLKAVLILAPSLLQELCKEEV